MIIKFGKKMISRRVLFAIIWIALMIVFMYITIADYYYLGGMTVLDRNLAYLVQVNIQKMFFNANILMSVLIYFNRKTFLEPIQAVRYGKNLYSRIMVTGFEYALIFTVCTYIVMFCLAIFLQMQVSLDYLGDMCFVFLIVSQMYLIYSLLYVITEKLAASLLSMIVFHVVFLTMVLAVHYVKNVDSMTAIAIYHWPWFLAADIALSIGLYLVLRKKDFIGRLAK